MKRRQFIYSSISSVAGMALIGPNVSVVFGTEQKMTVIPDCYSPVPVKSNNVRATFVGGKTVLTKCNGETIELNETGAAIWDSINGRKNCYGLADPYCSRYGWNENTILDDVTDFVTALAAQGYLVIAGTSPCYRLRETGR
jgi:hypothetical protein